MHTHPIPKTSLKREERNITFVFPQGSSQHCAGINSIIVSPNGQHLWTASRDSLIKQWNISTPEPTLEFDYQGHIDWVNSLAFINNNIFISCSNDKTLRVWNTSTPNSIACLLGHTDYVTSLATSTARPIIASAGLAGEIFLWDLSNPSQATTCSRPENTSGSIYSLACNSEATLLAAGISDGSIWLVDARTGRAETILKGHTGNVRALCMRSDGSLLISGSSDHAMRVWDIRQHRSMQTLAVHTDSVWSLAPADETLSSVYSGGRDCCVYLTELSTRLSEVVVEESQPVTGMALIQNKSKKSTRSSSHIGDELWVCTSSSTVHCWSLEVFSSAGGSHRDFAIVGTPPSLSKSALSTGMHDDARISKSDASGTPTLPSTPPRQKFVAMSLPALRARTTFEGGTPRPPPRQKLPGKSIHGVSPIKRILPLTDRRHVLTQDDTDTVMLWDVTVGVPIQTLGNVSLKDAEKQLFDPAKNVFPWFQPDTRLGCLAGILEPPGCFSAEAYRRDLGEADAPPDAKVNMAVHMLGALFGRWVEMKYSLGGGCSSVSGDVTMADDDDNSTKVRTTSMNRATKSTVDDNDDDDVAMTLHHGQNHSTTTTTNNNNNTSNIDNGRQKAFAAFNFRTEHSPVVLIAGGNGMPPCRKSIDSFDGREREGEVIPLWASECLLHGKHPLPKELKMAFSVVPAQGSGLPSLLQSKLNAPRVLGVDKVADYVLRKMSEQGVVLKEEPLFWSPEKQSAWEKEHDGEHSGGVGNVQAKALLITCGGAIVPWDFTLSAVKQWMWKRSEDLKLEFGVLEAGKELKLPVIRPPN